MAFLDEGGKENHLPKPRKKKRNKKVKKSLTFPRRKKKGKRERVTGDCKEGGVIRRISETGRKKERRESHWCCKEERTRWPTTGPRREERGGEQPVRFSPTLGERTVDGAFFFSRMYWERAERRRGGRGSPPNTEGKKGRGHHPSTIGEKESGGRKKKGGELSPGMFHSDLKKGGKKGGNIEGGFGILK